MGPPILPDCAGRQKLADDYAAEGLTVRGVPRNQFAGQEPGSAADIEEFCQVNYGVTFPLTEKVDVNGDNRHPLYAELTGVPDGTGYTGDIRWNFEKFVIAPDGTVSGRFAPQTAPDDPGLVAAVEKALPR